MSKEDYRDKIEEHRQSFEEEQEQGTLSRASRVNRNGGNNKKQKNTQRKTPLMTILFIIFILIPSMILLFVWAFYEPGKTIEQAEKETSGSIIEVAKPGEKTGDIVKADKDEKESKDDKAAQEQAKKDAEMLAAQDKAALEAKKAEEAKKVEDAKKAEEAKLAQQKAAQEAAAKKAEEARKAQEQAAANAKTHTVQANETLYRIAVNNYGDGSEATLAKIRAANGMSSDVVQIGQVIKLP